MFNDEKDDEADSALTFKGFLWVDAYCDVSWGICLKILSWTIHSLSRNVIGQAIVKINVFLPSLRHVTRGSSPLPFFENWKKSVLI